jgi:hypothetical protein
MPETRTFALGDILTITTECMLSRDGIGAVYEILNWMTRDNLFTHQLPRAAQECAPHLLKQHPDLAAVTVPEFGDDEQAVWAWLDEQIRRFGETRPVAPLHPDDHTRIDPLTELRMIAPHVPVIGVEIPPTHDA